MAQRRKRGVKATKTGLENLNEVLTNLGDGKRLTNQAIADKIQEKCNTYIDPSRIAAFRRGERISRENAQAICQTLDIDYKEILDLDEGKNNQPSKTEINWHEVCRQKTEKLRTGATEEGFELDIFVPLGLIERKQQQRRPLHQEMERDQVYEVEEKAEITRRFEHEEFLNYIGLGNSQGENDKHIAIIGEPGAGKTTLLQNLAQIISDQQKGLAICVSLGALSKERSLINYLEEKWLQDGLAVGEVKESFKAEFRQLFAKRQVWLILDGLDERSADSPVEALTWIEHEVRSGYLQKARVVVSCRVNVWDANITPLREFVTYKTLDFAEPQRDRFIEQWFGKKGNSGLGEQLIACLQETGRERIRELVRNPLRLVLLCQIWSLGEGELPETKAQFYQRYLPYFYEWKREIRDLTRKWSLQNELHQGLGKLAIASLESESRYRLGESFAIEHIGEKLFKLAVDFGWLNIVDRDKATDEAVYAFFHPTFQEFFAACGVEDWDFFLPRNHCDRPVEGKVYRIFEGKWKEVILLWLGRRDVKDEEKEAFIKSLVEFKGGCWDVYYALSYYLAAAGINEFKTCSLGDEIVNNIIKWGFGYLDSETEKWTTYIDHIEKSAKAMLTETDPERASIALIDSLSSIHFKWFKWAAARSLEKIGKGNETAILALSELINSSNNKYTLRRIAEILGKIDPGNETAISTLSRLIHSSNDEGTLREVAGILGKIDPGNETAISTLSRLIHSSNDEGTLWGLVTTLGQIGQGNETAILALIHLLDSPNGLSNRQITQDSAAKNLEKIGQGNETAILALSNLLCFSNDKYTIWTAAESLGKIGRGNETAILALSNLLCSSNDEQTLWIAAESLGKIDPGNQTAISALIDLLNSSKYINHYLMTAKSLGEIDPGNQTAISALIKLISFSNHGDFWKAADSLEKIGQGNEIAISALSDLLLSSNDYNTLMSMRRVEILGKIDPGNQTAISTLSNLICFSKDEFTIRNAAESLGEIGQGNETAISALRDLIHSSNDEFTIENAARNLEKIDPGNETAISALRDLIHSSNDSQILWNAASTLGEIRQGNKTAILALIDLIHSFNDENTIERAAESLEKIMQKEQMPRILTELKDDLSDKNWQNNRTLYETIHQLLWKCAQTLSYPEFYQAWHAPTNAETTPIGDTPTTQQFNLQSLCDRLPPHFLYLNTPSLNPYTLPELTQELCNLIHQKLNHYPIPEANNLPQLKRHLLPLIAENPQLTLIFANADPSDTLLHLCQQLNPTIPIVWITDIPLPNLQTFSPQQPNLIQAIVNWKNR